MGAAGRLGTWAAGLLGIAVPVNLVFFVTIALLFLVSLQYGAELTRMEEKIRVLAEESAFHERRLCRLEEAGGRGVETADVERTAEDDQPRSGEPSA